MPGRRPLTGIGRTLDRAKRDREQAVKLTNYAPGNQADITVNIAPGQVPVVSNVTSTSNVNTVSIKWDAVTMHDLSHYIVQVSANSDFTDSTEFTCIQPHFTYQEGDPDTNYYMRVKAVASSGTSGDYSLTTNTVTGLVDTANIADGAVGLTQITAGSIYDFEDASVGSGLAYSVTTSYDEITGCRVSVTVPNATRTIVKITATFGGTGTIDTATDSTHDIVSSKIQYGSGSSPSSWSDVYQVPDQHLPTSGAGVGVSAAIPHLPGAGVWTYRIVIQYTNQLHAGSTLVLDSFTMLGEVLSS